MSAEWKLVILAGISAILAVPLLTVHATIEHLLQAETVGLPPGDPGLAFLLLLSVGSLVPLALAGASLPQVVHSIRVISALTVTGELRCLRRSTILVLPTEELLIFTAGLVHPRIFVSTGVIATLTPRQMEAALLHEEAHIAAHDTRWRTALSILARAYIFLPRLRNAILSLQNDAEMRADERAVACGASRLALFDALVTVGAIREAHAASATRFNDGALESRLLNIAGSAQDSSTPTPWLFGWSLAGMATLPVAAHVLLAYAVICHSVMG